jgi:hypothetical protein
VEGHQPTYLTKMKKILGIDPSLLKKGKKTKKCCQGSSFIFNNTYTYKKKKRKGNSEKINCPT